MKPESMPAVKGKSAKKFLKDLEAPLAPEKFAIFNEADSSLRKSNLLRNHFQKKILLQQLRKKTRIGNGLASLKRIYSDL